MILGDLVTVVGQKIRLTDSTTAGLLRKWADARHRMICDMALWLDLLNLYTLSAPAAEPILTLPAQVDRVLAARTDSVNLMPVDQIFMFRDDPAAFDRTGTVLRFAQMPKVGTRTAPTSEKLSLISDNNSDTTQSVSIVGELAGAEKRETLTLNGTSAVQSVNSYDIVYSLTKQSTAGTVSVTGVTSAAALLTLLADETSRTHCRLRLLETPSATTTIIVLGKRLPTPLTNNSDEPAIRGLDRALEAFVMADALEWMGQNDDAKDKVQEAMALVAALKNVEVYQQAQQQVLIPFDGVGNPAEYWTGRDTL